MKSQIKDIVIGIFAVIGFTAIVMGFAEDDTIIQQPSQILASPESHVWEGLTDGADTYMFNKVTGEVRALSANPPSKGGIYDVLKAAN